MKWEWMRKGSPLLMHTFSVSLCPSTFFNAAPCSTNFTSPGGYIETPQQARGWYNTDVDCTYTVTVYMGYGVEIQVNSSHGAFVIDPVPGNDLNYCGNPVLLFYSWKVKCVMYCASSIKQKKNSDCFHTWFCRHTPFLPLVGQTNSPSPISHHWLSQCSWQTGWRCFAYNIEPQCYTF